ncbi:hypothetical protein SLEP1_g55029 [Rubroshorea leprosula]|uniref:Uncharacterized protein n=1 Tax=Rubroshorea leprosula TaxID=152421 RepID=A0AAV5ME80_9ROSI|nr:hypothetical protein SLEP1_g55029 [Rubroshorea leprosula]
MIQQLLQFDNPIRLSHNGWPEWFSSRCAHTYILWMCVNIQTFQPSFLDPTSCPK